MEGSQEREELIRPLSRSSLSEHSPDDESGSRGGLLRQRSDSYGAIGTGVSHVQFMIPEDEPVDVAPVVDGTGGSIRPGSGLGSGSGRLSSRRRSARGRLGSTGRGTSDAGSSFRLSSLTGGGSSCCYGFEHECSVANCNHAVTAVLDRDEDTSGYEYAIRVIGLFCTGIVACYSSIGLWIGIWNNASLTGLALIGCQVLSKEGSKCELVAVWLPFILIFFGLSMSVFAGSLHANGCVDTSDAKKKSADDGWGLGFVFEMQKFWESRRSGVLLALRGVIAYVGQVISTCGMYVFISVYYCQVEPSFAKDVALALFGLVGFTSVIIYFEYHKVGLSIRVMEGDETPPDRLVAGINLPEPQSIVHFTNFLDPTPLVSVEPWEEPYTVEEVREELDEIFPSSTPLGQVRSKLRAVMSALHVKQRIRNMKYTLLSLCSLLLQSCCWLGCDRIAQIWLFPGRAAEERGRTAVAEVDRFPFEGDAWPDYPDAHAEVVFMFIGMALMLATGTFLNHAAIECSRNVAGNSEFKFLKLPKCDTTITLSRTRGLGLALSWLIEFLGLCGNFINLTGFWYLIDEHAGLPETTGRNFLLLVFVFPLVFSGVFFNEAGVEEEQQFAVAYFHTFHSKLKTIAEKISGSQMEPTVETFAAESSHLLADGEVIGYSTALQHAQTSDFEFEPYDPPE